MTDDARTPDPVAVAATLDHRTAIIVRHYQSQQRFRVAHDLMAVARAKNIRVLIAGDWDLAACLGADGVHLPEYVLKDNGFMRGVRLKHPDWVVTAAAHSLSAAIRAEYLGADAVIVSPVFKTKSHPGTTPMGLNRFAVISKHVSVPVFAMGGVNGKSFTRLGNAGAYGYAGIGEFLADR